MLRYAKGKPLPTAVAEWQSAFLFGYIGMATDDTDGSLAEHALGLTVDVHSGVAHPAPTDAVRRFQNMKAACASSLSDGRMLLRRRTPFFEGNSD